MSWWWIGVVVGGLLSLIFAVVLLLVLAVVLAAVPIAVWNQWRDSRRGVTWYAPGLCELSSVDGKAWAGEIGDIALFFDTDGGPPSPSQLRACRLLCADLSRVKSLAFDHLKTTGIIGAHLSPSAQPGEVMLAELRVEDASRFSATLEHPSNVFTGYCVDFVDGAAVDSIVME